MLDFSAIVEIRKEAAETAESEGLTPLSILGFDPASPLEFIRRIPFLGDYIPQGWEHAKNIPDLFVDSTGLGGAGEPALSIKEFTGRLLDFWKSGENWGFGIFESGEFQVYIRVYKPDSRDFTHSGSLTSQDLGKLTARSY